MILKNKTAIVTGAGNHSGIGAATAKELARNGANVVITDLTSNKDGLDSVASEIGKESAMALCADVTNKDEIEACIESTLNKFGSIDILVNNAGVAVGSPGFLDQNENDLDITFGVNLFGLIKFSQAVIPAMMKQKDGVIVNIASLAGLKNIPPVPPSYTASKFAVIGITKAIAQEFGPYNINCNAVCPGTVDTDMRSIALENISKENGITIEEADLEEISMVSLGRAGKPEEIASLVTYLASPQSRYITGAAIPIDGGITFGL